MTQTCLPKLIHQHPLPQQRLASNNLPALGDVFADFRTAKPGQPVGIKIMVVHRENVLNAISAGALLLSQGPDQEFETVSARDAMRQPELLDAMDVLINTAHLLQDVEDLRWLDYGWQSSSEKYGYYLRELWIFPRAAVLMDNVHGAYIDDIKDLPFLAMVMHDAPSSNHDAFGLTSYINDLLHLTSTAAIPDLIEEWPEGVSQVAIPFAPLDPTHLSGL
jgi:hypothetical protein